MSSHQEQQLRLVCEGAARAPDAKRLTLLLAGDAPQAGSLDDMLWDMGDYVVIPHQIAGADDDEEEAAVLIAPPEVDAPLRPLVINLRDAAVEGSFERVLEVVPADDDARGPLRERWKQYKARGLEVNKYDM